MNIWAGGETALLILRPLSSEAANPTAPLETFKNEGVARTLTLGVFAKLRRVGGPAVAILSLSGSLRAEFLRAQRKESP